MQKTDLQDYKDYDDTESCYLDGRYFNAVLKPFFNKGVSNTPVRVTLGPNKESVMWSHEWKGLESFNKSIKTYFIRVIIQLKNVRHAALLIIDSNSKQIILWNPVSIKGADEHSKYFSDLQNMIKELFVDFVDTFGLKDYEFVTENYKVKLEKSTESCPIKGYCNAYVIKYILDWIDDNDYDSSDIKKFASAIQDKYSQDLTGDPDVEYFFGALLGGMVLGSALSAPRYTYAYPAYPAYQPYGYQTSPYGYYA